MINCFRVTPPGPCRGLQSLKNHAPFTAVDQHRAAILNGVRHHYLPFHYTTSVAMDRRQFMPRYTTERTGELKSKMDGPTRASLPRARRPPTRTAPPVLPLRNPRRDAKPLQTSESLDTFWQPSAESRLSRQSNGDIESTQETGALPATRTLRRSNSTLARLRSPLMSRISSQEDFKHSLHEEIKSLRQSYIASPTDEVSSPTPSPPLRRSASSASLRTSVRNFSLPSYSTPSTQQAPPLRALRRVRSRSVNLGPVAEASELPDFPIRSSSRQPMVLHGNTTTDQWGLETEPAHLPASSKPAALNTQQIVVTTEQATFTPSSRSTHSDGTDLKHAAAMAEAKKQSMDFCNHCGSSRKALAMNPICCVNRPGLGKVCFRCWSSLLAEGLSKNERKDWLKCVVCGDELVASDAKRLASRGTMVMWVLFFSHTGLANITDDG